MSPGTFFFFREWNFLIKWDKTPTVLEIFLSSSRHYVHEKIFSVEPRKILNNLSTFRLFAVT